MDIKPPKSPGIVLIMYDVVRQLNRWDAVVVCGGLALVAALEVGQPAPFGLKVTQTSTPTTKEALVAWRETAEGGAAFAIGRGIAYGWSDNHHSVETARTFALAFCAKTDPQGCRIIEDRDDSVYHPELGQVVSPKTARAYARFKTYRGAKAFAFNSQGYLGWSSGKMSAPEAHATAIAYCHRYRNFPKGVKKDPCKVVKP